MKTITSDEAKTKFSEILREAAAGEIFVITHNGQLIAELHPYATPVPQRKRGIMKKAFGPVPSNFNEPLNDFAE